MRIALLALLPLVAACAPQPMDPVRAADLCERRAQEAQAPTGRVGVGVNSNSGGFANLSVGVTGDYLAGRDPIEVYETCVRERTGAEPIRLPNLR